MRDSFVIPEGTYIMVEEPMPEITIEKMHALIEQISSERKLASLFAIAWNKAMWIADEAYDFEEGTQEYFDACRLTELWFDAENILREMIFEILRLENVLIPDSAQVKVIEPFMNRNGYKDGNGWWIDDKIGDN